MKKGKKHSLARAMAYAVLLLPMLGCSPKQGLPLNGTDNEGSGTIIAVNESNTNDPTVPYTYKSTILDLSLYGSGVNALDLASDGDLVYALVEDRKWGEEPEDSTQKQEYTAHYYVLSCKADGSDEAQTEIDLPMIGGSVSEVQLFGDGSVTGLFCSDEGDEVSLFFRAPSGETSWDKEVLRAGTLFPMKDGFVIRSHGEDGYLLDYYDENGDLTDSLEADDEVFARAEKCFLRSDGTFLILVTDDTNAFHALSYDPRTKETETTTLSDSLREYDYDLGADGELLLSDSTGIYRMALDETMPEQIFSYVDADLDVTFQLICQIEETRIAGVYSDGGQIKLGIFERKKVSEGEQKQLIVLGTLQEPGAELRSRIITFNKASDNYRIVVKQYISYDTETDAITRLNQDILSGEMPDILLLDDSLPLQSYLAKGLLADIGKLIDEDPDLERDQFLENVWDAFSVDGKLYEVIPRFAVDTLVAKESLVGDRMGWTAEEFSGVTAGLQNSMEILSELSRNDFLMDYMRICGREYVDTEQRKCDFTSNTFLSVLEFAATLPEEIEEGMEPEENAYDSRYLEEQALLQPVNIRRIRDLTKQINGCFGEDISYVGYPSANRSGSCLEKYGDAFVLSAQSDCMAGAWEFVRYYLTADYQSKSILQEGLPTRADSFAEAVKDATIDRGDYCFINEEFTALPPLSNTQANEAAQFIKSVQNTAFEDDVIIGIITEEAAAYFAGDKTAEDVAKVIQSRVQLYLRER